MRKNLILLVLCTIIFILVSCQTEEINLADKLFEKPVSELSIEKLGDVSIAIEDTEQINTIIDILKIEQWNKIKEWDLSYFPNLFIVIENGKFIGLFDSGEKYAKVEIFGQSEYYQIPEDIYDQILDKYLENIQKENPISENYDQVKDIINAYLPTLDKEWHYYGLAEYGHIGVLKEIDNTKTESIYEYYGAYNDGSGIPDEFVIKYTINYMEGTVKETVLSNTRGTIKEVNSKFHDPIILKLPLEKSKKWTFKSIINNSEYDVKAEIIEFDNISGRVKVKYIATGVPGYYNETYFEERTFEKGYGMTGFINIFPGELNISEEDAKDPEKLQQAINNHTFGYSINKDW